MSRPRPFRFGVIAEHMTTKSNWTNLAKRAESLGYSTLLIRDHLVPDFFGPQFGPIAAMMAAASATTTLRVGTMVIDNDFRHPALLAKEMATVDLLSDGRLELGIGAGWLADEYEKTAIRYDPAGVRIDRMVEGFQIIKGLWRDEPFSMCGEHYRIAALHGYPQPMQQPHPPILIGGGSPRILRIAGREADIVGVLTTSVATGVVVDEPLNRTAKKVAERISSIREGAGDRFECIELSMIPSVTVASNRSAAIETLIADRGWVGVTLADVDSMPTTLIGSTDEIAEQLIAWRERLGFSYIVFTDDKMDELAPIVARLAGT